MKDVLRIERAPWQDLNLPRNIYDVVARTANEYPDKVAFNHIRKVDVGGEPKTTTYKELLELITSSANLLYSQGIRQGDVVSLFMPVIPEALIAFWAAQTAGVGNPVNAFLEIDHLTGILEAADTKAIIFAHPSLDADAWGKVQEVRKKLPDITLIQVGGYEAIDDDVVLWRSGVESEPTDHLKMEHTSGPEDITACFHTGGTTGVPKLAGLTPVGQIIQAHNLGSLYGRGPEDARIIGAPMFHVGGPICFGLVAVMHGESILFVGTRGYRDPQLVAELFRFVERFGLSELGIVPATWSALLNNDTTDIDLSTMKVASTGGALMPAGVAKAVKEKFDITCADVWGMTDAHGIAAGNPPGNVKPESIGIRLPYMELRCVELDENDEVLCDCETDKIGTIIVRGPQVFKGYLTGESAWVDGDWFNTGDLARIDSDGYIFLTGRSKDLIIRAGHNIDPALIEDALAEHEAVELAAAVGRPDAKVGEMPIAYVQIRKGFDCSEQELLTFLEGRIAERAAFPKAIYIIDEMPVTAVHKIFKPELRRDAIERALKMVLSECFSERATVEVDANADKTKGTVVDIRLMPIGHQLSGELLAEAGEILAGYSLHCNIKIN